MSLVVSRKLNEELVFCTQDGAEIAVVSIREVVGDKFRVATNAPAHVTILRGELYARVKDAGIPLTKEAIDQWLADHPLPPKKAA